jgi:hypothetical protein
VKQSVSRMLCATEGATGKRERRERDRDKAMMEIEK